MSSTWWSSPPQLPELLLTTPLLHPADGCPLPVGAALLEDELGVDRVRARPVRVRPDVRVVDVHDAATWCALVQAHPRRVTWVRRSNWREATGWEGSWALPDWSSVAQRWDGVHLSVRGYLAVSGRLLTTTLPGEDTTGLDPRVHLTPGPARTLLAGWSPGETYWLTDVVEDVGEPVTWRRADDCPPCWVPVDG